MDNVRKVEKDKTANNDALMTAFLQIREAAYAMIEDPSTIAQNVESIANDIYRRIVRCNEAAMDADNEDLFISHVRSLTERALSVEPALVEPVRNLLTRVLDPSSKEARMLLLSYSPDRPRTSIWSIPYLRVIQVDLCMALQPFFDISMLDYLFSALYAWINNPEAGVRNIRSFTDWPAANSLVVVPDTEATRNALEFANEVRHYMRQYIAWCLADDSVVRLVAQNHDSSEMSTLTSLLKNDAWGTSCVQFALLARSQNLMSDWLALRILRNFKANHEIYGGSPPYILGHIFPDIFNRPSLPYADDAPGDNRAAEILLKSIPCEIGLNEAIRLMPRHISDQNVAQLLTMAAIYCRVDLMKELFLRFGIVDAFNFQAVKQIAGLTTLRYISHMERVKANPKSSVHGDAA